MRIGESIVLKDPCLTVYNFSLLCHIVELKIEREKNEFNGYIIVAKYFDFETKYTYYNTLACFNYLKNAIDYLKPIISLYGIKEIK